MNLQKIVMDLEYAAFNLCDDPNRDVSRVIESTCPEATLLICIHELKQYLSEPTEKPENSETGI